MGATEFFTRAQGKTAAEAFASAREDAQYECGHGGYTGTIAEKHEYKAASHQVFESYEAAIDFADLKIQEDNHWCQDKWGAAAYVSYKHEDEVRFLFFGVASC